MFRMRSLERSRFCTDIFLINTVRPVLFPFLAERLVAWSLYLKGATVYQLIDFDIQPHYDSKTFRQAETDHNLRSQFSKLSNKYLIKFVVLLTDRTRLRTVQLKDYVIDNDNEATTLQFRNHVISSCRRYDSRYKGNCSGPGTKYYDDCELIERVWRSSSKNILRNLQINKVISSHGIYVTWGIMHDISSDCGLNTYVISKCPYVHKSVWLTRSALQKIQNDYEIKSISDKDKTKIKDYFSLREQKLAPDTQIFYEESANSSRHIGPLALDERTKFVVFPNVIWDGAIEERDDLFDSIVDWLYTTIKSFEHSTNELIVRFHPSEVTMFSGSESFENIITEMIPDLANLTNVTIISSDSKVNVFELIKKYADCVLVYDNMTALEAVYCGKAVIYCASARFESAGFGYKPINRQEYSQLLQSFTKKDVEKLSDTSNEINMYSFANWYLNELVYSFPVVNFDDDLRKVSWSEIQAIPNIVNSQLIGTLLDG